MSVTQIPCHLNTTMEYDEPSVIGQYKRPNQDTADLWAFPNKISLMDGPQTELYDDLIEIYRGTQASANADFVPSSTPLSWTDTIDILDLDIIRCVSVGKPYRGEYWRVEGNPLQKVFLANKMRVYAVRIEDPQLGVTPLP